MRNHKLALGMVISFLAVSESYANNIDNQVFLTNSGSVPYQLFINSGSSNQTLGQLMPPGSDQNLQFTITTPGECSYDTKTTTYNIQVVGEHRLVLCEFNFDVAVTNNLMGKTKSEVGGCDTSGSTIAYGKVEPIQGYSNNTGDTCSASWSGQDEIQGTYQSGQLKVTVSKN